MRTRPIHYCEDTQAADVLVLSQPHHFGRWLVFSRVFPGSPFVCWHCVVDDFGSLVPIDCF